MRRGADGSSSRRRLGGDDGAPARSWIGSRPSAITAAHGSLCPARPRLSASHRRSVGPVPFVRSRPLSLCRRCVRSVRRSRSWRHRRILAGRGGPVGNRTSVLAIGSAASHPRAHLAGLDPGLARIGAGGWSVCLRDAAAGCCDDVRLARRRPGGHGRAGLAIPPDSGPLGGRGAVQGCGIRGACGKRTAGLALAPSAKRDPGRLSVISGQRGGNRPPRRPLRRSHRAKLRSAKRLPATVGKKTRPPSVARRPPPETRRSGKTAVQPKASHSPSRRAGSAKTVRPAQRSTPPPPPKTVSSEPPPPASPRVAASGRPSASRPPAAGKSERETSVAPPSALHRSSRAASAASTEGRSPQGALDSRQFSRLRWCCTEWTCPGGMSSSSVSTALRPQGPQGVRVRVPRAESPRSRG